jgi:hypothetical protein
MLLGKQYRTSRRTVRLIRGNSGGNPKNCCGKPVPALLRPRISLEACNPGMTPHHSDKKTPSSYQSFHTKFFAINRS